MAFLVAMILQHTKQRKWRSKKENGVKKDVIKNGVDKNGVKNKDTME